MNKLDILYLQFPNLDRDFHISVPTLVYLNKKYNLRYKIKNIWLGHYYLLKYKPRILILPSFQGAAINNDIVKLAYASGVKVVTFMSEGNVKDEALDQFLWGWNKDKRLYVDKMLVWSKRSQNIFLNKYPELVDKLVTIGATGFDRYKLMKFRGKKEFLEENELNYNKIIGIAAWGFDHYFGDYYKNHEEYYLSVFGKEQIVMHQNDLFLLQKIYEKLIKENKDILFILRFHPMTIDFEKNEFFGLEKYKNVFISNKYQNNQYKISDLINVSDLWIGYETTTALESWFLNKQTFLINPTRSDFIRENVHKGSPIVKSAQDAQVLMDEYFNNGTITEFECLQSFRGTIIKDVIEYDDGKNYIRSAEEIIKIFNQPDKKIKYSFKIYIEALKQISKLILSKTIFKNRWPNLNYKSDFSKKYQEMYDKAIDV